jgi:hypothetical protein
MGIGATIGTLLRTRRLRSGDVLVRNDRAAWDVVRIAIADYGTIPASEGVTPPSTDTITTMSRVVDRLERAGIPPQRRYWTIDGEIGLEWRTGETYALISLNDAGRIVCYLSHRDQEIRMIDEPWSVGWSPDNLIREMRCRLRPWTMTIALAA